MKYWTVAKSMGWGRPIWTSVVRARRLRSAAGSINSGRHILAFTMRRLRKRRVFDFVPSYLKNLRFEKSTFKQSPKETCSDIKPRLTVRWNTAKFKLLASDRQEGKPNDNLRTHVREDVTHFIAIGHCEAACWTLNDVGHVEMCFIFARWGLVGGFLAMSK